MVITRSDREAGKVLRGYCASNPLCTLREPQRQVAWLVRSSRIKTSGILQACVSAVQGTGTGAEAQKVSESTRDSFRGTVTPPPDAETNSLSLTRSLKPVASGGDMANSSRI